MHVLFCYRGSNLPENLMYEYIVLSKYIHGTRGKWNMNDQGVLKLYAELYPLVSGHT